MRYIIIFLVLPFIANPQNHGPLEENELDDPDETQYLDQLLNTIFQPFSIETADANALADHGYSSAAIETILTWQEGERSLKSLRRKIHGSDLILLKKDIKQDSQQTQIQMRQRIQYSPSLNGWRILNKGRLRNRWGSAMVLSEQDPGESELTDHSIFTLSSQSIPHFDNIILGDFHVSWGGGLILNQQGSRPSLHPGSLIRTRQSTIRPHYSSREIDYFRGIAGSFSFREIRGATFISSRVIEGTRYGDQFKVDGDGIHPTGRIFEYKRASDFGLSLETVSSGLQLYGSTIYNPHMKAGLAFELGLSSDLGSSQKLQFYTNSLDLKNHRIIGTWAYLTPDLHVSLQYRHFSSHEVLAPGAIPTLLGTSASNEKGLSARAHLRPNQKLQIRYAFDTGLSIYLQSVHDYRAIQQHKVQVIQKLDKEIIQIDFSQKKECPVLEGDVWAGQLSGQKLTKGALSLTHIFSSQLNYRVNIKSAFHGKETAFLIQQRLTWEKGSWKWATGYVRFSIPDYTMRLSVYETSVAESFGFYTAFDDGDRWFLYLKQQLVNWFHIELKLVQTRSFEHASLPKQLAFSLQMSVVL